MDSIIILLFALFIKYEQILDMNTYYHFIFNLDWIRLSFIGLNKIHFNLNGAVF